MELAKESLLKRRILEDLMLKGLFPIPASISIVFIKGLANTGTTILIPSALLG